MGIIVWIIFGALIGWLSAVLTDPSRQQDFFGNVLAGIVGALIGGFLMNSLGFGGITSFNAPTLIVATVCAFVSLAVYRAGRRDNARGRE